MSEETLAERDKRLLKWLATVKPDDIVTIRLNNTDTLTGKVYEVKTGEFLRSLCVNNTILRHANGFPGGSYDLVEEIDYKELLFKYMEHVGICEGVDFIGDHHRTRSQREGLVFTDEEWAALNTDEEVKTND